MKRFLYIGCCLALSAGVAYSALAESFGNLGLDGIAVLQKGRTMRSSSSDLNWREGNGDARPIAPGGMLVLADLKGPGEIRHIWNTIAMGERGYSRLLVLRMYWDGETNPSVECPVGDFFGIGHGLDVPFDSLPVRVTSDGKGRNCYWPMPFRKSAKITVTNEGRKRCDAFYYYVDWQQLPRIPKKAGYFHAMYRQEFPAVMGRNYLIAELAGRGQYVGTVLNWRQRMPSWPGEGDDFFFIDGETEPSLRGTGTEDYFCDGWGFRKQAGIYYGAPLSEFEPVNGLTSVYRWHIADPVTFEKSLHLEIEHKGPVFNEDGTEKSGYGDRPDDVSSVAFWYQVEPHRPFEPMPEGYARLYYNPNSIVEGEGLIPDMKATSGAITRQDIGGMSGGAQAFWTPTEPGQKLSVSIPVAGNQAGTYDVTVLLCHSYDYGIFQFELDGKPWGAPIDLYNPSVSSREHMLPPVTLSEGNHVISIVNKGKNSESKGYYFGVDGFTPTKR